jgi:3-oxoacyl-[acyl-carrier protein] reductase
MDVKGNVALVTGGANGIGEAVSKNFAKAGAKVAIVDMSQKDLDRVVSDIKAAGGEAIGIFANVTKEEDTAKFVSETLKAFGQINFVVPSAGIIRDGLMLSLDKETGKVKTKMTLDNWKAVIDINLTGTFLTIRDCAEAMVNNKCKGVIFPISSISKVGLVGQLNYSSTKVAVALFPKILVGEFQMRGIKNIRVVGIAPGFVGTPLVKGMKQEALNAMMADVHIGRLIEPDEISKLILSIIDNETIDGTTIEITGGITYKGGIAR